MDIETLYTSLITGTYRKCNIEKITTNKENSHKKNNFVIFTKYIDDLS